MKTNLREAVRKYLSLRRSLGYKLVKTEYWLNEFAVLSVTTFCTFSREFPSFYCDPQGEAIIIRSWLPRRDFNANMTIDFVNSLELLAISRWRSSVECPLPPHADG